ncbi:MAG: hypothetical protein PUE90_10720, partial [Bacteroidales bacterium]|nr:hypothetical protein [Bacteroidales bacterium]
SHYFNVLSNPSGTSPFQRCECKGTANLTTHQTFLQLFCVKKHIFRQAIDFQYVAKTLFFDFL